MDIQAQTRIPLFKSGRYALTNSSQCFTLQSLKLYSTNHSVVLEFVLKFGVWLGCDTKIMGLTIKTKSIF